jgi:hypothetical protein
VLAQDLIELVLNADARVDDNALLSGSRRDDPAVGAEGGGGEPADEHSDDLSGQAAVEALDPTGGPQPISLDSGAPTSRRTQRG